MDLTEKPHTKIIDVKVVSTLPSTVNGKASGQGLTAYEAWQKLGKLYPDGFRPAEARNVFETCGLSSKSVSSALFEAVKRGFVKVAKRNIGPRGSLYKFIGDK